jgi:hypothetical protein
MAGGALELIQSVPESTQGPIFRQCANVDDMNVQVSRHRTLRA